jgi:hypothetical protein
VRQASGLIKRLPAIDSQQFGQDYTTVRSWAVQGFAGCWLLKRTGKVTSHATRLLLCVWCCYVGVSVSQWAALCTRAAAGSQLREVGCAVTWLGLPAVLALPTQHCFACASQIPRCPCWSVAAPRAWLPFCRSTTILCWPSCCPRSPRALGLATRLLTRCVGAVISRLGCGEQSAEQWMLECLCGPGNV